MSSDDLGGTSTRLFAPYSTVFDSLVGQSVTRLAMNQSTVAVFFENRTKLHLECEWLYQAASGDLIDRQTDFAERICFGLWQTVVQDYWTFRVLQLADADVYHGNE